MTAADIIQRWRAQHLVYTPDGPFNTSNMLVRALFWKQEWWKQLTILDDLRGDLEHDRLYATAFDDAAIYRERYEQTIRRLWGTRSLSRGYVGERAA